MKKHTKKELNYIRSMGTEVLLNTIFPIKQKNSIRIVKGGKISFNPATDTGPETALLINSEFYILLGDQRKHLKNSKTMPSCIKIFDKLLKDKKAKLSPWSNYLR